MSSITNPIFVSIVGDKGVGKSSFISRHTSLVDEFPKNPRNHDPVDLIRSTSIGDITFRLFDGTTGLRSAQAVILMFDVTNENSFKNLDKWFACIKKQNTKKIPIILCANKIDAPKRLVLYNKIYDYLLKIKTLYPDLVYHEISVRTNYCREKPFHSILTNLLKDTTITFNDMMPIFYPRRIQQLIDIENDWYMDCKSNDSELCLPVSGF